MFLEIATACFVTHTALLTARMESRFYRSSDPHRGILVLLFVFITLFSLAYFVIDFITPIKGYSGIREFGFDVFRLSEVLGQRERIFLVLIFAACQRFLDLYKNYWKRLFIEEEWFHFIIAFVVFWVFAQLLWGILWIIDIYCL
jgi:hypothetical protein